MYIYGVCIIRSGIILLSAKCERNKEGEAGGGGGRVVHTAVMNSASAFVLILCVWVASCYEGTAACAGTLADYTQYSPGEARDFSEDSSLRSPELATASCPSQMKVLHTALFCLICVLILSYRLRQDLPSGLVRFSHHNLIRIVPIYTSIGFALCVTLTLR